MLRWERHSHGPRVYVLGRRVHECHLGGAIAAAVAAGWLSGAWRPAAWSSAALGAGVWMVAKDWRDLFPSLGLLDTGAWRVGLHRRFAPLRVVRYGEGLPTLAALVALALGVVNLASALTPNIAWRHHLLLQIEPVEAVPVFHTLAVPASVALVAASVFLRRRRRRAWLAAVLLLLALGVLDLVKGFDFEEALLSFGGAALLWWGRDAFYVRHPRLRVGSPLWLVSAATAVATAAAASLVWSASGPGRTPLGTVREVVDLLAWRRGSVAFHDELAWLPLAVGLLGLVAVVVGAALLFRPLGPPQELPDERSRRTALDLLRAHGSDTLAFFKLRRDIHYLFSGDGQAFVGYRVEGGVLVVSGDPVGPSEALPQLVRELFVFAELRGLRVAAVGASGALLPLWQQAGLRSLYIGDEAVVETRTFSVEGRAIRKVRQSVTRIERAGYRAEVRELEELGEEELCELEHVSSLWRGGTPEVGFSMAMDSLRGTHAGSVVIVARDGEGAVRGFLHFVPTYGRPAMSLSFMRRDRQTPNGLTEFLVVRAVELLRDRGVDELSLNFAAFARLLAAPTSRLDRLLARVISLGNPFFQIESLYRFNAKFAPRWEPRYLVYEGTLGLARAGLAAMRAEGQLPRLRRG